MLFGSKLFGKGRGGFCVGGTGGAKPPSGYVVWLQGGTTDGTDYIDLIGSYSAFEADGGTNNSGFVHDGGGYNIIATDFRVLYDIVVTAGGDATYTYLDTYNSRPRYKKNGNEIRYNGTEWELWTGTIQGASNPATGTFPPKAGWVGGVVPVTGIAYDSFWVDSEEFIARTQAEIVANNDDSDLTRSSVDDDGNIIDIVIYRTALTGNKLLDLNWYLKTKRTMTTVLFGDSLTHQGDNYLENPVVSQNSTDGYGYMNHGRAFLDKKIEILDVQGHSGNRLDELETKTAAVTATGADFVLLCGGRNDVSQGRTYAQMVTSMENILDDFDAVGMRIVLLKITPVEDGAGDDAADLALIVQFNAYLDTLPSSRHGLLVVDSYTPVVNPATGYLYDDMSYDGGTHWGLLGASLIGRAVAAKINKMLGPDGPDLAEFVADGHADNAHIDPEFEDAAEWTVLSSNTVQTFEASDDYPGRNKMILTATNCTLPYVYTRGTTVSADGLFNDGDEIVLRMDVEWDASSFNSGDIWHGMPFIWVRVRDTGDIAFARAFTESTAEDHPAALSTDSARGIFETPPVTLPVGTTTIHTYIGVYGINTGVVTIHNLSMHRI